MKNFKVSVCAVLVAACLSSPLYAANKAPDINWKKIPGKETIKTGIDGAYSRLTTTDGDTYRGYFSAAANSDGGKFTRRMWFSETPMGKPIETLYPAAGGVIANGCDVSGVELKLSWSQEPKPKWVSSCKLKLNTTYYLNYTQAKFGAGSQDPTASSAIVRGASTGGKPKKKLKHKS